MRDAVLAGLTLDTFNRHADKVGMAAVAQLVNCLHVAVPRRWRSVHHDAHLSRVCHARRSPGRPIAAHAGVGPARGAHARRCTGQLLGPAGIGVAQNRRIVLTLVNPAISEPRETEIAVRGANVVQARWTQLASTEIHAHNSFDAPDAVRPTSGDARLAGSTVVHTVAPASVTRIDLTLA